MWIAVLVVALIVTVMATRRHLHMFQLNSYRPSTHWAWLGEHRRWWVPQVLCAVIAPFSVLSSSIIGTIILVLLGIALISHSWSPRSAKKPLVFTARVIRMSVTIAVLVLALALATILAPPAARIMLAVCAWVGTPVWVLLANAINSPIEAAVRRYYLRDAHRRIAAQPRLTTIGITGSYGKTSTKFYLGTLLRARFNVLVTPESYNTPMGITKTIRAELRATHEVFVCEMGAEKVGEIKADCDLVNPEIGMITAIGEQHLVTFGSQENIVRTKLELAEAVKGKGTLYLNGDNEFLRANRPDQECLFYGLGSTNDTYAHSIAVSVAGTTFSVVHRGVEFSGLTTALIGAHSIQNLTGAIAVAMDLGLTEAELRTQLRKLAPAPHRLALSRQADTIIIDDAYNSNPAGAKAALDTLMLFEGMKILITPGMVQLGERQDALNEQFGVQAAVADHVFLVGAKQTAPIAAGLLSTGYDPANLTVVDDVRQAIAQAQALPGSAAKVILLENDLPDNY